MELHHRTHVANTRTYFCADPKLQQPASKGARSLLLCRCPHSRRGSAGGLRESPRRDEPNRYAGKQKFTKEPFAKFGSALGQPWVSPWERGRPARILVKALPRRQSAGEPTNPVKPIATTLPSLVRAGRPRSQGSQPFPAINPTYWRILQKAQRVTNRKLSPLPHLSVIPKQSKNTFSIRQSGIRSARYFFGCLS